MFDAKSVKISPTTDIVIENPVTQQPYLVPVAVPDGAGGERTEQRALSVTVHGPGTKEFKAAQAESQKAFMATFHRGKSKETPAQKEAREAEFLTACTVSFNNFTYGGGDARSNDTFRACYLDAEMGWITSQVNDGLGDWAGFMQAAPTS